VGCPLRTPAFRRLLAVYLVNGIASAVPATLVLFFIRDRLQAPAFEPLFLASYFAAGALSMPLWVRLVARIGLARSLAGRHGAGHRGQPSSGPPRWAPATCSASRWCAWPAAWRWAPTWRCPARCWPAWSSAPAMAGALEGGYFGWWNFATKLNLALAAGVALPLLGLLGYAPGRRTAGAAGADRHLLPAALRAEAAGRGAAVAQRHPLPEGNPS
jgi:GPH family glycoside/pentoside/hexuronide:cation symporter